MSDSTTKVAASAPASNFVNLTPKYLPILVDKVVEFIYTGDYTVLTEGSPDQSMLLQHATGFRNGKQPASSSQPELFGAKFHMHMGALAEDFKFPSLYEHAHKNMVDLLTASYVRPLYLASLVDAAFAPHDSELRVCVDEEGWMQRLIATTVLVQEAKHWDWLDKKTFSKTLVAAEYNVFWDLYDDIRADCVDLLEDLEAGTSGNGLGSKGKGTSETGLQKRNRAKKELFEKKPAALYKEMGRLEVDGYESLSCMF
jgi:hypothetical protein